MKQFKVGDNVISLTSSTAPGSQVRKKGKIYQVDATAYCIGCGNQRINIGQRTDSPTVQCGKCDVVQATGERHWTSSEHFIKIDPESISQAIEECVENENYEDAAFLRDFEKEKQC
jgi:hypothetical protein